MVLSSLKRYIASLPKRRIEARLAQTGNRLCVLGIVKNEVEAIDEWVEHYLWQGAAGIFVIDNGSDDGTLEALQKWVERGKVELIQLNKPHRQRQHYWTAIKAFRLRQRFEWLLIADADEFWFCRDGSTLQHKLDTLEGIDWVKLIYARWTLFGSSGHDEQPASIRKGFVHRQEAFGSLLHAKWICRTADLKRFGMLDIHRVRGICSSKTVMLDDIFQVNHYQIQSRSFYTRKKLTRGDVISARNIRHIQNFEELDQRCTVRDDTLANRVPDDSRNT
ncbi:Glycosyl transferase family 2 [Roseovarius litoreus]|uniref:Glycosyl transferase family 2 n=1 Tax=Roseovarius litoreus TaxID=1155722 RepID=A0A1M7A0W9_9RHOB|nr:glycosyltransferase family 2 protein [Roseovarius litoreus]SHL36245.1 Glycosyl transferase family 2 [Roseovarius litoreus]